MSIVALNVSGQSVVVTAFADQNQNGLSDDGLVIPGISTTELVLVGDLNTNGVIDGGEPTFTHTEVAGVYTFNNGGGGLPDGDYILQYIETPWTPAAITAGNEVYFITLLDAGADTDDNDVDPVSGVSASFTVSGGATEMDVDLGLVLVSAIGDFVWEDSNGDGLQNGELGNGLDGVTVNLLDGTGAPALDINGSPVPPQVTAGGGMYLFGNITAGDDFIVEFTLPTVGGLNWFATTFDGANPDASNDSDANPANTLRSPIYSIAPNIFYNENIDAGFYVPVDISDFVFCDENGNGTFDAGEGFVRNIDVDLIDIATGAAAIDAAGNPLTTMSTGSTGMYLFELVPPGTYRLEFSGLPPNYEWTRMDGSGSDCNDSDVDSATGITDNFMIVSRPANNTNLDCYDAGAYQLIDIIGNLWLDENSDDTWTGEGGPNNVLVQLWDDNGSLVDSDNTAGGTYEFLGLPPGQYFILIPASNFDEGSMGPLFGTNSCELESGDPGDMIDNDDNGPGNGAGDIQTAIFELRSDCQANEIVIEYIDFCFFFDCDAQNPLADDICDMTTVICDLEAFSGFCSRMPDYVNTNGPGQLCPSGGVPNNMSWFSFVAPEGSYDITFTPFACTDAGGGNIGVQLGVYTDCTFTESVVCNSNCSVNPVSINSADLNPGQTYYFFIDGCAGSVCSYTAEIVGTFTSPTLDPSDMCILEMDGSIVCDDANYCPGVDVVFQVQDLDAILDYFWIINNISGAPYAGDLAPITEENILTLSFPDEGVYEICFDRAVGECNLTSTNSQFCRTITVAAIADEIFDDIMLCDEGDFMESMLMPLDPNGDGNTGWQGATSGFTFGTNTLSVTQLDGCMYEQEVELIQFPPSDKGVVDTIVCRDDLPIFIDGIQYTEGGFGGNLIFAIPDLPLVNSTDVNGCDSIIDLRIEILDVFMGSLSAGICLPDEGVILNFTFDPSLSTSDPNAVFTYEWLDPNNNPLADVYDGGGNPEVDNIAPSGVSGIYTLVITIELNGKSCEKRYTVDINYDDLLPQMPTISGNNSICESDSIQTYTAGNIDPADMVFNYIWDAPTGVEILSGGGVNDNMIEINWAGTAGGELTLIAVNGCGESTENPVTINLVPILTPAFTATSEVCVDSSATIMYMGDQTNVDSYMWNFDGGTINNATGGIGPGPHEVSWADDTDRTVTLTVMHDGGCMSTEVTQVVTIVERLTPPSIMCTSQLGEVTFSWDVVAGTTAGDYAVDITTGQSGTLTGNEYTVTGLGVNEQVDITLTIMTNDACVSVSTTSFCIAQNCTPPIVGVSAPGDVIAFCLNGTDQSFDLVEEIPAGVAGSGTFMGSGIIDTLAGTFNPDSAAVGPNTVFYSYLTDDGCTAGAQITIQVSQTPVASFILDRDTICITESVSVTYDGTPGISDNTYMTSDGLTTVASNPTITFTETGSQTITLVVERNDCTSEEFTRTVFVEDELEPISVGCTMQELDNVEFGWDAVAGATGYFVEIVDEDGDVLNSFTTTDLTYGEGGLNPGDSVIIVVTVLTDNRCGGSSDTQSCIATDCPTVGVAVTAVADICVDPTSDLIDLTATLTGGDGSGVLVWQGNGVVNGNQFDPTAVAEGATNITVEYIENGCGGYMGSTTINVTQTPTASFDAVMDPICAGGSVAITYTGSQLAGQTIDWSMSDVAPVLVSGDDYMATFPDAGTYDIILNVTNGACTTAPDMVTITVEEQWDFDFENTCMPTEESVTFTWTEDPCATGYEVFIDNVSQGTQTEATYTQGGLMPEQEVEIRVEAISGCACDNVIRTKMCQAMACVQVSLDVSAMGGVTEFCLVEGLSTIDVLAIPTGNTPDGVGMFSGDAVDPMTGTFDPIVAGVGEHTVYYTYIEPAGCETFVDSVTFNIFDLPAVSADFLPIDCYADSFTMLTISPIDGDGNYTITANDDPIAVSSEVAAGSYDILVTDGNGCSATTDVTITILAEPNPTIDGAAQLLAGEMSTYEIQQSIFTGQAIDSIVWVANGVVICNDPTCFSLANQTPMENTTYTVTVFYNNGCSVTDSFDVEVREPDPIFTVDIPNIFAPNGSGANTLWKIYTGDTEVVVADVKIFDRWGSLVFSVDSPYSPAATDVTWDGKLNGSDLQPGVYVYMVKYVQDGRERIRNGDITIIE